MNVFSIISEYKWLIYLVMAAALAGGLRRIDSHAQQQGYARAQAEYTAQALKAAQAARAREQALQSQVTKAQDDAQKRQTILTADAGRSHAVADSLRNDLAGIRASLPGLARDAVDQYADTASVVFAECVREYSGLAETADRIDNDRQALTEGWPK